MRIAAGIAGALVCAALVISGSAAADPTAPTLDSIEPPPPPPPPVAAAPNPAPAPSRASDEAAVRQVIQALVGAFNAQNWDAMRGLYCSAKQAGFSVADMQGAYNDDAPIQIAVNAVAVIGDSATAAVSMIGRSGTTAMMWPLVREGGWKICRR